MTHHQHERSIPDEPRRPLFAPGEMQWDEDLKGIREAVERQARLRNDALEEVVLESLAAGYGVLVTTTPDGGEVAAVDSRVPHATMVYAPSGTDVDPTGLEPASIDSLHALLLHVARKALGR